MLNISRFFSAKSVLFGWGIFMTFLGLYMMIQPSFVVTHYSVEPQNATGWSALSGNFAALISVLGLNAVLGVVLRDSTWIINALLVETLILLGRFWVFVNYGITESVMVLIVAEIGIGVVMIKYLMNSNSRIEMAADGNAAEDINRVQ